MDHLDTMQALIDFAAAVIPIFLVGLLAVLAVEETR